MPKTDRRDITLRFTEGDSYGRLSWLPDFPRPSKFRSMEIPTELVLEIFYFMDKWVDTNA